MRHPKWIDAGLMGLLALACGEPTAPVPAAGTSEAAEPSEHRGRIVELVTGGGQFVHPDFGANTFAFVAVRHRDGRVSGKFFQHQPAFGFTYAGDVTCFAVDRVNHRAWIGGVLTHSNDPDPITEVGDDAWFRVLDPGHGNAAPDRSTFLGFEGGGGIITSEEYCRVKIWPDDNARAWPVERGNILIH